MPSSSTSSHLSPAELSYLHSSLSSHPPIRPDARLATDFRPFSAETNVLPNTMGSAHVGFADGREAVVGIRAEVERTPSTARTATSADAEMTGTEASPRIRTTGQGKSGWITLSLTLPGLRDDDTDLIFLEEMLREGLVSPSAHGALQDALVINQRWHWRLYLDVVLISPPQGSAAASFPLPLLSMAIHLALRDTRIPRLKSEGEEDPMADDDWEASVWLFARADQKYLKTGVPPVTLLVMVVGENVIFDPSGVELAVADGVFAITVGRRTNDEQADMLGVRTLETSARSTFKGVPKAEGTKEWESIPGVWKPKAGGIKRSALTKVLAGVAASVGKEVVAGLDAFALRSGTTAVS